jgi:hypothetical protein
MKSPGAPDDTGRPRGDPPMNSRLIPWCLAATGFLAALTVFSWHGKLNDAGVKLPPASAMADRFTPPATDPPEVHSAQVPAVAEPPQHAPATLTLPLPPGAVSEPDADVQPVSDDAPTVEDLPAPHSPAESSQDQ